MGYNGTIENMGVSREPNKGGTQVRESRMSPIGANTFGIYIDKVTDGEIFGRIAGGGAPADSRFTSLTKMILLVDELLDRDQWEKQMTLDTGQPDFELEILFRQNYSWQGRLRWLAGGKEATFRSVLELIVVLETTLARISLRDSES